MSKNYEDENELLTLEEARIEMYEHIEQKAEELRIELREKRKSNILVSV